MTVLPLLAALVALPAWPARADEAEDLNTTGKIQYGRGDLEAALGSFRAAWGASPQPKFLVNVARTLEKLDRPLEAVEAWQSYRGVASGAEAATAEQDIARLCRVGGHAVARVTASQPGAVLRVDGGPGRPAPALLCVAPGEHRLDASLGALVARDRLTLRAREDKQVRLALAPPPATVHVTAAVLPAQVLLDDQVAGEAPLDVEVPASGTHTISVTAEGRSPFTVTLAPAPGERLAVEAWADQAALDGAATSFNWGWVTLGAGAAALVAGGVLYGVAYDRYDTANGLDPRAPGYGTTFDDLIGEGEGLQIGAYVSFGIAGALAIPTLFLLLDEGDDAPPEAAMGMGSRGLSVTF